MLGADEGADALFYVALGWVAAQTGSPAQAAAVLAAGNIPRLAVLLLGGVIGDRFGVARIASLTLGIRLLLMAAFAGLVVRGLAGVWQLSFLAGCVGLADALHMPAMRGVSGLLAEEGDQIRVQSAMSAVSNGSVVIGTAAGGVLLSWKPTAVGVVAAGLLVVASAALLRLRQRAHVKLTQAPSHAGTSMWHMLRSGVETLVRDRITRLALIAFALINLTSTAPIFLGIPLRAAAAGWGPVVYSLALLGFSVGYMVGGIAATRLEANTSGEKAIGRAARWFVPGVVALTLVAISANPWVVSIACFATSVCFAPGVACLRGVIQERTPPEAMGRANSVVQFAIYSGVPLGFVIFGALAAVSLTMAGVTMVAALGLAVLSLVVVTSRRSTTFA